MDQEYIAKKIKELRTKNNLTQKEFADKMNVTFQAVSKWENGKSIPDISILKKMSEDFNINLEELLGGEIPNKKKNYIIFILISIVVIVIGVVLFTNKNNFSFKKITTNDNNFKVTGSLAYDKKGKIYIYITDINYVTDDKEEYKNIKVSLYEDYKGVNTKIKDCDEEGNNTTIKEHLEDVTFNVDDYKSSCDDLTKSKFYIEVEAINKQDKAIYYKIPLELEDICPVK
jgi:transcriptional regulator with XRE-family HTH domain